MGIGDWGLGIGDWAQSPIPNNFQIYVPLAIKKLKSNIFMNNILLFQKVLLIIMYFNLNVIFN